MLRSLGPIGVLGILLALAGIVVVGYVDPLLAAGFIAVIVGAVLVVQDLLRRALGSLGLGGGF